MTAWHAHHHILSGSIYSGGVSTFFELKCRKESWHVIKQPCIHFVFFLLSSTNMRTQVTVLPQSHWHLSLLSVLFVSAMYTVHSRHWPPASCLCQRPRRSTESPPPQIDPPRGPRVPLSWLQPKAKWNFSLSVFHFSHQSALTDAHFAAPSVQPWSRSKQPGSPCHSLACWEWWGKDASIRQTAEGGGAGVILGSSKPSLSNYQRVCVVHL